MIISDFLDRWGVARISWVLLGLLLVQSPVLAFLPVQDDAWEKIQQAERLFDQGKIDDAINILELLLDQPGLTTEHKQKAYELLAANYLAKMYEERADRAIRKLLELVPNYRPDPRYYSQAFIGRVEAIRKELAAAQPSTETAPPVAEAAQPPKEEEKESFIGSTVFWVGAGVLVAGAVTVIAVSGGNGAASQTQAQPLPPPPNLP